MIPKKPVVNVTDEDLSVIEPQLRAAYDTIRAWPLGRPANELAALVTLKVIAATSVQLREAGLYDRMRREQECDGPDDGGFF